MSLQLQLTRLNSFLTIIIAIKILKPSLKSISDAATLYIISHYSQNNYIHSKKSYFHNTGFCRLNIPVNTLRSSWSLSLGWQSEHKTHTAFKQKQKLIQLHHTWPEKRLAALYVTCYVHNMLSATIQSVPLLHWNKELHITSLIHGVPPTTVSLLVVELDDNLKHYGIYYYRISSWPSVWLVVTENKQYNCTITNINSKNSAN